MKHKKTPGQIKREQERKAFREALKRRKEIPFDGRPNVRLLVQRWIEGTHGDNA